MATFNTEGWHFLSFTIRRLRDARTDSDWCAVYADNFVGPVWSGIIIFPPRPVRKPKASDGVRQLGTDVCNGN